MKQKTFQAILLFTTAFRSLQHHRNRNYISILILSLGISLFVSTFTATLAFRHHLSNSFSHLGLNHVSLTHFNDLNSSQITHFCQRISNLCHTTVSITSPDLYSLSSPSFPDILHCSVIGIDSSYLSFHDLSIQPLPSIFPSDIPSSDFSCILGASIADDLRLTSSETQPTSVFIQHIPFTVIGSLPDTQTLFSHSVLVPMNSARNYLFRTSSSYMIDVRPNFPLLNVPIENLAHSLMRNTLGLSPVEDSNFTVQQTEHDAASILRVLNWVDIVSAVISFVTLLASSISLMNMMLVQVRERGSEIGLRKAMGATPHLIRLTFVCESLLIALSGSLLGFFSGTLFGFLVTLLLNVDFVLPFNAMFLSGVVGIMVSLISTWIPASKAAKLDPILSLRC